jgi:hypothetical protein
MASKFDPQYFREMKGEEKRNVKGFVTSSVT